MIYFLKTTSRCNNNCNYCNYLNKKSERIKTLPEIEKELEQAKRRDYNMVQLSCNTDTRKDFITILELIKKMGFKIILETNARIFYYLDFTKKISKYIYQYEIYFDLLDTKANNYIARRYAQNLAGIKNIKKYKNISNIIIKVVLLGHNLSYPELVIDQIYSLGIKKIKLIIPFKFIKDDVVPALMGIVPLVTQIKKYAKEKKIKVINGGIEFNPYITSNIDSLDIKKAELRIDLKKFKEKPKFSVIIPTHNKKDSLLLVLNSFFQQSYAKAKLEIIVIDDGSSDNTEAQINKLKPNCNFKYWYWPRKRIQGCFKKWARFYNRAGLTRNIGINQAQGEIILFNDNDILVNRNCLKQHALYHNKYANIIVRGLRMYLPKRFLPNNKKIQDFNYLDKIVEPEKTEYGRNLHCRLHKLSSEGWQRIIPCNLSLRKKYLEKAGLFHSDSPFWGFEDIDLGYRLSKLNMQLMWDDKIKVYHLPHHSQTGNDLNTLSVFWINLNILYRKYLDEEVYNLYKDVILYKLDNIINKKLC